MERRMFVCCALLLLNLCFVSSATPGTRSCVFESSSGTIDLTPLGNQDNDPRFKDFQDPTGPYTYSFNPCFEFNEADACSGVELCQHDLQAPMDYDLGSDNTARFSENSTHVFLTYATQFDIPRTSVINLVCDATEEGTFDAEGENPIGFYHFTLRSKYACPGFKTTKPPPMTTPPPGPKPTAGPAPGPSPSPFVSLKTVVILLGAILVSLCILILQVFIGLLTR